MIMNGFARRLKGQLGYGLLKKRRSRAQKGCLPKRACIEVKCKVLAHKMNNTPDMAKFATVV